MVESLHVNMSVNKADSIKPNFKNASKKFVSCTLTNDLPFPLCKESHYIYNCEKFLALPPSNKYTEFKRLKLCTNCLRDNHAFQNCTSGNAAKQRNQGYNSATDKSSTSKNCHPRLSYLFLVE